MCYPVCGMLDIKDPMLLIEKRRSGSVGSGFPLSLSDPFLSTLSYGRCHVAVNKLSLLLNLILKIVFLKANKSI